MIYQGVQIICEEGVRELIIAELSNLGFNSFEEMETGLKAFCDKDSFSNKDTLAILKKYDVDPEKVTIEEIPETNWNAVWEENFDPVTIDDQVLIRAPFHPSQGFPFEIVLSPKMAFGTGHHATTYLMVKNLLGFDLQSKAVLDIGTGTGVLAILASQMGAENILATDVDQWSINNSNENAAVNNVVLEIMKGSIEEIESKRLFDVVLANINKNVILKELKFYSKFLLPSGYLLLSGFYVRDCDDILLEANIQGLTETERSEKEDWASLILVKN